MFFSPHRAQLSGNGNLEPGRKLVNPISMKMDFKRAIPPIRSDLNWEISGKLKHIHVCVHYYQAVLVISLSSTF